jgi:hypothetical protein
MHCCFQGVVPVVGEIRLVVKCKTEETGVLVIELAVVTDNNVDNSRSL